MVYKKILDLDLFEHDVWLNFCYYYQCDLVNESIKAENSLFTADAEKLIKRMQQNDFPFNEERIAFAKMMGEVVSVPFNPFQISELLIKINKLRLNVDGMSTHFFKRQYSDLLILYVDTLGAIDFIQNKKLARSAKGILAVKARYERHLYPRREILYRILKENVAQNGKWSNLNQAINFILDDLVKAFEVYDVQWLKSELLIKQVKLKELEQSNPLETVIENDERKIVRRKTTPALMVKKTEKLHQEIKNLNHILKAKYPSKEMERFGYKMPYSGGYIAETIIHELRNQPDILKEILF
jgi:hypothetical protein